MPGSAALPTAKSPANERRRLLFVALAGVGLLGIDASFVVHFPILRYVPGGIRPAGYEKEIFGQAWVLGVSWFVAALTFAVAFLVVAWRLAPQRSTRAALFVVFGFPALFAATLSFMYPVTGDIFQYFMAARILWVYHQNPILTPANAHPFIIDYGYATSPYGPLWQILTGPMTIVSIDHWIFGFLGFKLLATLAYLACSILIYRIALRLRPEQALRTVILFAWNPLVTVQALGIGRNDIVMLFFVLLTIYLVVSERWRWVFPALGASILVKYTPAILVPFIAIYAYQMARERHNRRILHETLLGCAVACIGSIMIWAPLWDTRALIKAARYAMVPYDSTLQAATYWLVGKVPAGTETITTWTLLLLLFGLVYTQVLLPACRPRPERLISLCILVMLSYLALASNLVHPNYFLWVVPLTVLQPSLWYAAIGISLSYLANLIFMIDVFGKQIGWIGAHPNFLTVTPAAVQFLPPLLLLLAALAVTRSLDLRRPGPDEGFPSTIAGAP